MTETKLLELVMIVKNSGEILRRCLIENKKFIDEWTILDTGSTDNTPEIIRETLSDIPGVLHFGDFIDFSTARNKAMDLSKQRCKFMVILDDSYILNGGDKLRKLLKNSKKSCYLINIGKYVDGFLRDSYFSKRIVKTSEKLRYKYRIHEEIHVPNQNKMESIEDKDIFIDDLNFTPHTKRSLNRFSRDIDNLLLDYKDYPNEQRVIYYLGKTYYLLQKYDKAVEYFSKLKYLKHAREDFEFSGWYDTACINYLVSNNIDKLKEELLFITQKFPYRAEAWYKLAVIHNDNGDIEKVNELIKLLMSYPKPKFMGTLFESDIYDYYIPYLFVDTSIKIGNIKEAIYVLKSLLEKYPSDQPLLNIRYSLCDDKPISSIKLSENNKTIVFHTSGECEIIKCWNPNGDMRISGSEFMAMNMAQEFYKLGYRVFIIGTIEDKKIGVNHEGTYKNIEYIDYKYFSEFASKYEIDYLIVSRFTANLTYYYNIKRVYLWIHDVLPIVDDNSQVIQHHKEKFKCIIAVSNWQKNNTMKMLNVPDKSIIVSRNAIYPERFLNKEVVKVPYRFIYTSCPQRGLDNLIKIIPQIK
jgi:tetratricopeptide (TPR) repeat protein